MDEHLNTKIIIILSNKYFVLQWIEKLMLEP